MEAIDLENASIMELEAFISMADQAESVLQEEKNHHTAEDMCEIAIEELKVCSKSPIEMYRARTYATEFNGIIREIKDMGSQYNEVCYLK